MSMTMKDHRLVNPLGADKTAIAFFGRTGDRTTYVAATPAKAIETIRDRGFSGAGHA
jgi:hypothetical protein